MPSRAFGLLARVQEIYDRAEAENRPLSSGESADVERLLERAEQTKGLELRLRELDGGESWTHGEAPFGGQGPGDLFVKSEGYARIASPQGRGQTWTSGAVDVSTKGTLVTTPGSALAPGEYQPGIVSTLYQPTGFADLFGQATTSGSQVRCVQESVATNAAAATAETGTKPESTLTFTEAVEPVRKVATILPVSDEMLEDAPSIAAYLNQRLALFVSIQEEAQLLSGNGTAPNLTGMVGTSRAIGTYARGTADDNALAIYKAANGARGSSFLDGDAVVIHPTNWQAIRTAKDAQGQYYGGGPFGGSYGSAGGAPATFTGQTLWGMSVFVSSNITLGTALVGSFRQGAAVVRRSAVTVEATNSHGSISRPTSRRSAPSRGWPCASTARPRSSP